MYTKSEYGRTDHRSTQLLLIPKKNRELCLRLPFTPDCPRTQFNALQSIAAEQWHQSSVNRLNCLWRNLIGPIEGGQEVWNLLFSDDFIGFVLWRTCEIISNGFGILGKHSSERQNDQTATKALRFQPLGGIRGKSQWNYFQCRP